MEEDGKGEQRKMNRNEIKKSYKRKQSKGEEGCTKGFHRSNSISSEAYAIEPPRKESHKRK